MTRQEGRGVEQLMMMLDAMATNMGEGGARSFIDGLDDEAFADVLTTISAAQRATDGEPHMLFESAAARLRGVDVASVGSLPVVAICGKSTNSFCNCLKPVGHDGDCSPYITETPETPNASTKA